MSKGDGGPILGERIDNLILKVVNGNSGALRIVKELMWFTHWVDMLEYLIFIDLVGSKLWEKVADEYHHDFHAFGKYLDMELLKARPTNAKD